MNIFLPQMHNFINLSLRSDAILHSYPSDLFKVQIHYISALLKTQWILITLKNYKCLTMISVTAFLLAFRFFSPIRPSRTLEPYSAYRIGLFLPQVCLTAFLVQEYFSFFSSSNQCVLISPVFNLCLKTEVFLNDHTFQLSPDFLLHLICHLQFSFYQGPIYFSCKNLWDKYFGLCKL